MEQQLVRAAGHTVLAAFIWVFSCIILTFMTTTDFAAMWLFGTAAAATGYLTWVYRRWKRHHGLQDHNWHFAGEQALISLIIANAMLSASMGFIVYGEFGEFPLYENISVLFFLGMFLVTPAYFIGRVLARKPANKRVYIKGKRKAKVKNEALVSDDADTPELWLGDLMDDTSTKFDDR